MAAKVENNDPVWVLATGLITELVTFQGCDDWKKRPSDIYGPFGDIGKGLLRATVEGIQINNKRAGLDPLDRAEYNRVATGVLENTNALRADKAEADKMNSYDLGFLAFKFNEIVVLPSLLSTAVRPGMAHRSGLRVVPSAPSSLPTPELVN